MIRRRPKIRVIVRPWAPRKIPYSVSIQDVKQVIAEIKKIQVNSILTLYVGWSRKKINSKKTLRFLVAIGKTSLEARKNFKQSNELGKEVWII